VHIVKRARALVVRRRSGRTSWGVSFPRLRPLRLFVSVLFLLFFVIFHILFALSVVASSHHSAEPKPGPDVGGGVATRVSGAKERTKRPNLLSGGREGKADSRCSFHTSSSSRPASLIGASATRASAVQ
jgi:hypothetical protein